MSEKSAFDISTKTMLDGFSKILKQDERQNVINLEKLKKAIQYLETGKNKERDVAMFLMELSFGLERRKLRFLKWRENFDWNNDGSIKEKLTRIIHGATVKIIPRLQVDSLDNSV